MSISLLQRLPKSVGTVMVRGMVVAWGMAPLQIGAGATRRWPGVLFSICFNAARSTSSWTLRLCSSLAAHRVELAVGVRCCWWNTSALREAACANYTLTLYLGSLASGRAGYQTIFRHTMMQL